METAKVIFSEVFKWRNINAIFVLFWCTLAIVGHSHGIPWLTTLGHGNVDMKIITALLFILVAMNLFESHKVALLGIPTLIFISLIFGYGYTNEPLVNEINTVANDVPSLGTLLGFSLCFVAMFRWQWICGLIITILSALAFTGYILNVPPLYCFIPDVSTAVALNTAIAFVHIGLHLVQTHGGFGRLFSTFGINLNARPNLPAS